MYVRAAVATFALLALGCASLPITAEPVAVVNQGSNKECERVFRCDKVNCTLENPSADAVQVELTFRIFREDGSAEQARGTVALTGKEMKTFSHEFEGGGFGKTPTVECVIEP